MLAGICAGGEEQSSSLPQKQDFLSCSFGGRPGLGAHHALATLNEVIAGSKVGWVLEADLKNFFGRLDHGWLLRLQNTESEIRA